MASVSLAILAAISAFLFFSSIMEWHLPRAAAAAEMLLTEPKIVYVDGNQPWDNCRAGLKRSLNAMTGLLISHPTYGSASYNASRNCFLTIAVPIGYRIRLKALDFDVQGRWRECGQEDTLHVFDHDQQLEPHLLATEEPLPIGGHSPGRILGEFCGRMEEEVQNGAEQRQRRLKSKAGGQQDHDVLLAESTHNALTLWWHTEPLKQPPGAEQEQQQAKFLPMQIGSSSSTTIGPKSLRASAAQGFRLLWSSFRLSTDGHCRQAMLDRTASSPGRNGTALEFRCADNNNERNSPHQKMPPLLPALLPVVECIPSALACNSYADCSDASDLDTRFQLDHGCEHIPNSPLGVLSGPKRLLLCAAVVLSLLSICMGCCCCLLHHRRLRLKKKRSTAIGRERCGAAVQSNAEAKANRNGGNSAGATGPLLDHQQQHMERGRQTNNDRQHHQHLLLANHQNHHGQLLPGPPLPPPCFSPPALPSNRPPPAPLLPMPLAAQEPQQQQQQRHGANQHRHHRFQHQQQQKQPKSVSGTSNSQQGSSSGGSSSSHPHQQQQQQLPNAPHTNSSSGGRTTATTAANSQNNLNTNNSGSIGGGSGKYFYVQQQPLNQPMHPLLNHHQQQQRQQQIGGGRSKKQQKKQLLDNGSSNQQHHHIIL